MAIEFKHGGRIWRADTPDEAIDLRRKLERADQLAAEYGEEPDSVPEDVWTADKVTGLLESISTHQRQYLLLLTTRYDGIAETEIGQILNLKSAMSLAGVLSGISKQLKKLDLRPSDLYKVEVRWAGKDKTRTFKLANQFRWAAQELGWPESWGQDAVAFKKLEQEAGHTRTLKNGG